MATEHGAGLILLHVLRYPYSASQARYFDADVEAYYKKCETLAQIELERLLDTETRRFCRTRNLVVMGTAYLDIVRVAKEEEVDLVVMPTHSHTGVFNTVTGSVTARVLRLASCPVMTVAPEHAEQRAFSVSKIICATDFSDLAKVAVPYAVSIASTYGADLLMLHVSALREPHRTNATWRVPSPSEDEREAVEHAVREQLDQEVPDSLTAGIAIESRVVQGYDVAAEIARTATDEGADLIVLASHGLTGMSRLLLGSTAEKVIRLAPCPVLTVKPGAASAHGGEA